jgi:hypothetical protein
MSETKFYTHTETTGKIIVLYMNPNLCQTNPLLETPIYILKLSPTYEILQNGLLGSAF